MADNAFMHVQHRIVMVPRLPKRGSRIAVAPNEHVMIITSVLAPGSVRILVLAETALAAHIARTNRVGNP